MTLVRKLEVSTSKALNHVSSTAVSFFSSVPKWQYKGDDEWKWPVHDTPSGSADIIPPETYENLITALLCGIVSCGHGFNSISHSTCTERISELLEEGGFHFHAVSRGDNDYAHNYFFVEVSNVGLTYSLFTDILKCLCTHQVNMYKVKNRRQVRLVKN